MIATVIVTYNRLTLLKECIAALEQQTFSDFDIIVVNNNSTDGTGEYLSSIEKKRIKVINLNKNIGGAGGFNAGLRYSVEHGYSHTWLMDDDVIPSHNSLEILSNYKKTEQYGFLSSSVLWTDGSYAAMNIPKFIAGTTIDSPEAKVRQATFVSFFIPSDVVLNVGLPIKDFFIWGDDFEYSLRISEKFPCYFVKESKVIHKMKINAGSNIALDVPERIPRYFYAFRNEYYVYNTRGLKWKSYYWLKCILNATRIIFIAKDNKKERLAILKKGVVAGKKFKPEIEYIE